MGTDLLEFYRTKLKSSWKTAFISTFLVGLFTHIYKFTNTLPNHDSLFNSYSSQNMVASGRWFLSVVCSFSSFYDLPWINGLFSLIFIALTAVVITDIFKLKNPVVIILSGALLATFPALTQTFFYEYTADGYMIAMLLAALSVRLSLIGNKKISHLITAASFICLACAIYQAYVSFALVLAIFYFMYELIEGRRTNKEYLCWIGIQAAIYASALAVYYIIWQVIMRVSSANAVSYFGIDEVGSMSFADIIKAVMLIAENFIRFFIIWDFFEYGLTLQAVINMFFLAAFAVVFIITLKKSGIFKRKLQLLLILVAMAAIPFAAYIWTFTTREMLYGEMTYGIRMLQSMSLIYIFASIIADRWVKPRLSNVLGLTLCAVIIFNCVTANISYYYLKKSYDLTYASAVEMSTRIHMLDDGTIEEVVVVGTNIDFTYFTDAQERERLKQISQLSTFYKNIMLSDIYVALFLDTYTNFRLSYYGLEYLDEPLVELDSNSPSPPNWEFYFPLANNETKDKIIHSSEFASMGCWPAADSVQVIDGVIVVKLSRGPSVETAPISSDSPVSFSDVPAEQ